jgi:probable addiction module antidote protein
MDEIEIRRYATRNGRDIMGDDWDGVCLAARGRRQAETIVRYSASAGRPQRLSKENAMRRKASVSHDEATVRELRANPELAAKYLKAALEDSDEPGVLLIALRRVAEARGGVARVAKAAGVQRESLYRALSSRGNPRLSTLLAVAKAVGLKLTVEAAAQ